MIFFTALAVFAGITALTLLDVFYDEFAKWLKTLPKLLDKVIDGILIGCKTFINIHKNRLGLPTEISKNYSKIGDQWEVTTATREISDSEVPNEIRYRNSDSGIIDITDELDLAIK